MAVNEEPSPDESSQQEEPSPDESLQESPQGELPSGPSGDPSPAENEAPTFSREATEDQVRAIMGALGCPADARSPEGCRTCAVVEAHTGEGEGDTPYAQQVQLGRFLEGAALSAMVSVSGCSTRAGGETAVFLVAFDGSSWSHAKTWNYNDTVTCVYPRRADGLEHIVCLNSTGHGGCYFSGLVSPEGLPIRLPRSIDPWGWRVECEAREMENLRIEDLDGDGDDELLLEIEGVPHVFRQGDAAFTMEVQQARR